MEKFDNRGGYAGYNKNNSARQKEDYYATPPAEVTNILKALNLNFTEQTTILEPSCGGGHMLCGIDNYCREKNFHPYIYAGDIVNRNRIDVSRGEYLENGDFLAASYPVSKVDYVIMNPPFKHVVPFVEKSLNIATKGVVALARLQFLEGKERYKKIFTNNPPTSIYVYVDRINCYKNGDFSVKGGGVQCYAWFYWNLAQENTKTTLEWIRRVEA